MYGLDFLALPKYLRPAAREFPRGWALGCFSSMFGDARASVKNILDTKKCPRVRIHLAWKDAHNFSRRDFPAIVKEAQKWQDMVRRYPQIEWYFSGACEHLLSASDAMALAKAVHAVLPTTKYSNAGKAQIAGPWIVNEVHGSKAKAPKGPYIFSFDGSAAVDSDVETLKQQLNRADTFYLWEPRFNGRWETTDTTPREQRKGWPDARLIRSVIALAGECGAVGLPKGWLYKSHAENKGDKDPRAECPVVISPIKLPFLTLKRPTTGVPVTLKYYGPYQGGGYRYYASRMGHEIATEPCELWGGDRMYGIVNPVFRYGNFR